MIPTPGQPDKSYGIGAVTITPAKRSCCSIAASAAQEIAQLLEALVEKHPTGPSMSPRITPVRMKIMRVEAVVRAAAGRFVLLSLPTSSPWLTPIEMLWRHFRREVTHGELFETKPALLEAAQSALSVQPAPTEHFVRHWLQSQKSCLMYLARQVISFVII